MKANLEFNLDEFEDKNELDKVLQSSKVLYGLSTFREYLRNKLKYAPLPEDTLKIFREVNDVFYDCLSDVDLDL